jgi:hypothetical protein
VLQALSVVLLVGAILAVVAVAAVIAGSLLSTVDRRDPVAATRASVARTIERFLTDEAGEFDWDEFLAAPLTDPELESIRARCAAVPAQFPPNDEQSFCSPEGRTALLALLAELRGAECAEPGAYGPH